jgi:hypothetical protein
MDDIYLKLGTYTTLIGDCTAALESVTSPLYGLVLICGKKIVTVNSPVSPEHSRDFIRMHSCPAAECQRDKMKISNNLANKLPAT